MPRAPRTSPKRRKNAPAKIFYQRHKLPTTLLQNQHTKSAFIRRFPNATGPEIVRRAGKLGLAITVGYVAELRYDDRVRAARGAALPTLTKAAFVRSLPLEIPASEVVARAAERDLNISAEYVHATRCDDRHRMLGIPVPHSKRDRRNRPKWTFQRLAELEPKNANERAFLILVGRIGLGRARELVAEVARRTRAVQR
jgi:hypothetical protein